MKNTNFMKNKLNALLALSVLLLLAFGCGGEKPSAPPTESDAQSLVKSTLSDFADAVDKGDFTAFKANASKEFQTQFSDDQLKTSFKDFITNKAVVVPMLRDAAKKNAAFSPAPSVREEKGYSIYVTNGTVDVDDQKVKVNNEYVYQDSKWKLLKVGIVLE